MSGPGSGFSALLMTLQYTVKSRKPLQMEFLIFVLHWQLNLFQIRNNILVNDKGVKNKDK